MPLDDDEIVRRLDAMPMIAPPHDLRPAVLSAIRGIPLQQRVVSIHRSRRTAFAIGWSLAAALVLLFVVLVRPRQSTPSFATMAPIAGAEQAGSLTLSARQRGDVLSLEPELSGPGPVTITVGWDPESAVFSSVSGVTEASSRHNQSTFTLRGPSDKVVVSLRVQPGARSTVVRVSVDGRDVIRADVPLE